MSFQFVSELTGEPHDMDIPLNVEFLAEDEYTTKSSPFFHGKGGSITQKSMIAYLVISRRDNFIKKKKQMDKARRR